MYIMSFFSLYYLSAYKKYLIFLLYYLFFVFFIYLSLKYLNAVDISLLLNNPSTCMHIIMSSFKHRRYHFINVHHHQKILKTLKYNSVELV